jgi:hypothetical protein
MNIVGSQDCSLTALRFAAGIKERAVFRGVDRRGHVSERNLYKDSVGTILQRAVTRA